MKDTIESVTGFIKELIDEGRARASSRWFANLVITFLFFNWKNIVEGVIPIKPHTADSIITLVDSMFWGHSWRWYVALVLVWAFWVLGKPAADTGMNYAQHKIKQWVRFKKVEATITRENRELEEYYRNQQTIESDLLTKVKALEETCENQATTISNFYLQNPDYIEKTALPLKPYFEHFYSQLNYAISQEKLETRSIPKLMDYNRDAEQLNKHRVGIVVLLDKYPYINAQKHGSKTK